MYSSLGYDRFQAFCTEADITVNDEENVIICDECTSILEDKDDEPTSDDSPIELTKNNPAHNKHFQHDNENIHNITTQLNLQKMDNDSLDLLNLHTNYGHIPFTRLKEMAKQGIIPSYHQHTKTPACAACLFDRVTRKQ